MTTDAVPFEDSQWKASHTIQANIIGDKASGRVEGTVEISLNIWKVEVPIVLPFINDGLKHLDNGVYITLDASVRPSVI